MTKQFDGVVRQLLRARRTGAALGQLPLGDRPADLDEAYAVQQLATGRWPDRVVGWKVGATSKEVQDLFGISEPVCGPVFAATVFDSTGRLRAADFQHRMLETEFAFVFGKSLPGRQAPYRRDEVLAAIAAVVPAFEIINPRFERLLVDSIPELVADFCANGGAVLGRPFDDWRQVDLVSLPVSLSIDGVIRREGTGAAVLGDPVNVLVWFDNAAQRFEITEGQFVLTGTITGIHAPDPGQTASATFGDLGSVEAIFVAD